MAVLEAHAELGSGQGFDDLAFHLNLIFFFGHNSSCPAARAALPSSGLLAYLGILAALDASDGLFLFHAAKFALGNKPALAADGAQDAALHYLLAEAFQ